VTIKQVEVEIIDRAWAEGWVPPRRPAPAALAAGRKVAVIGSGPAGLAAAQQLTRAGHAVTVFERADAPGGLLRYGIPEFKMEKRHLDRRLIQMLAEGTEFRCGVEAGLDITAADLRAEYAAIVLAAGATVPRGLPVPGSDLAGIHQAMEYLPLANRAVAAADGAGGGRAGDGRRRRARARAANARATDARAANARAADARAADARAADARAASARATPAGAVNGRAGNGRLPAAGAVAAARVPETAISARGRDVVIIGGGDTGADCLGTALRQGAASVTQLEILPRPPGDRPASQPWPVHPAIFRVSGAHEEGGDRVFAVSTKRFLADEDGRVRALVLVEVAASGSGFQPVPGTERELACDLVLLAMGFTGAEVGPLVTDLGVEFDHRGNVARNHDFATSVPGVFVAGDAGRGQSLIVWAIAEGRSAAAAVDSYLCGDTNLPAAISPTAAPLR
jgi:glutamate synthase (NADPH) small chain